MKFISTGGTTLEMGDFYGGGNDEVVTFMERVNTRLKVVTNSGEYLLPLQEGDYIKYSDNSTELVKSKTNKNDSKTDNKGNDTGEDSNDWDDTDPPF